MKPVNPGEKGARLCVEEVVDQACRATYIMALFLVFILFIYHTQIRRVTRWRDC